MQESRRVGHAVRITPGRAAWFRPNHGSGVLPLALALGFGLLGTLGTLAISRAVDRRYNFLTAEPAVALDEAAYLGFLSNVTTVVGAPAAFACLLAWVVLGCGLRSPWLWGALVTSIIVANDFYLLDDHYLSAIGVPEPVTSAFWLSFLVAYVVVFREDLRRFGSFLLMIAVLLFGTAELLDRVSQELDSIEDGLRFVATVSLASFFVPAAVRALREEVDGRPRSWVALPVVVAYAAAVVLLGLVIAAANALDRSVAYFTREPADAVPAPAYVGILSNTGALAWLVAATSCLVAWLALDRSVRSPFMWGGVLTTMLLADDFFLLHDHYLPALGVPQRASNAVHVAAVLAYLVAFRRFLREEAGWLLLLALSALAISLGLDVVADDQDPVEDSSKFIGICLWAAFFSRAAAERLRRAKAARGDPGDTSTSAVTEPRTPRRRRGRSAAPAPR